MASTVPSGDYDDVVADFEVAQTKATALAEENSGLTADLASLSDERDQLVEENSSLTADLASLSNERDQLVATIAATAIAAKARAYIDLNLDAMYVEERAQAGTDFAPFDELLATLGEDMTLTEWVNSSSSFRMADQYVYKTEDTQLIDAWNEWLGAEIGSVEEESAYNEVLLRLDQLNIQQPRR
jgi:chromosome segregation ATPase